MGDCILLHFVVYYLEVIKYSNNLDHGDIYVKEFKLFRLFNPLIIKGVNYGINSTGAYNLSGNTVEMREEAIEYLGLQDASKIVTA